MPSDCEVLHHARQTLSRGWTQKGHSDAQGGYCIVGALCRALGEPDGIEDQLPDEERPMLARALLAIGEVLPSYENAAVPLGARLVAWNDAAGRQRREVIALIDAAIQRRTAVADKRPAEVMSALVG